MRQAGGERSDAASLSGNADLSIGHVLHKQTTRAVWHGFIAVLFDVAFLAVAPSYFAMCNLFSRRRLL